MKNIFDHYVYYNQWKIVQILLVCTSHLAFGKKFTKFLSQQTKERVIKLCKNLLSFIGDLKKSLCKIIFTDNHKDRQTNNMLLTHINSNRVATLPVMIVT